MEIIPDWRVLVVQAGGFLLVLLVFKLFLFRPITELLDRRRSEIAERYADAESKQAASDKLRAEYENRLADAEAEMRRRIADAVKEAQAMREEIMADTRSQADRILNNAQEQVSREAEQAMVELRSAVADLAVQAAGKLIEEQLDSRKHHQLIGKFIDQLDEARPNDSGGQQT